LGTDPSRNLGQTLNQEEAKPGSVPKKSADEPRFHRIPMWGEPA
jgi:hypothetical protein